MTYGFPFSFQSLILGIIAALVLQACKQIHSTPHSKVDSNFVMLDIADAKNKIILDSKDQFFEKIGQLDMELQMNRKCSDRNSCIKSYKEHIQNSVLEFSAADKKALTETMDSAMQMVNRYFPNLFLPQIELIKINANHYGNSVYYTRENAIIIPENELKGASISSLLPVMLHEISHIITRYNSDKKEKLYGLIGFKKLNKEIRYSENINQRLLSNPDGLDNSYYIELSSEQNSVYASPILVSTQKEASDKIKGFMNYIKFDLYELEELQDYFLAKSKDNGFSNLRAEYMPSFFEQIKENTQYIIHPDEIIADNFMMLLITERDGTIDNFNDEGQILLAKVKSVLAN